MRSITEQMVTLLRHVDDKYHRLHNNDIARDPAALRLVAYPIGDGEYRWELSGADYHLGLVALHLPIDGWEWDSEYGIWHTTDEVAAALFSEGNRVPIEIGEYGD